MLFSSEKKGNVELSQALTSRRELSPCRQGCVSEMVMKNKNGVLIKIQRLRKNFGSSIALVGVDLEIRKGESLTLFGPNGAGKTTLIKIIAGLLKPTSGTVEFEGKPLQRSPRARKRIGLLSHQSFLYTNLTGRENLSFFSSLYPIDDAGSRIEEVISEFALEDHIDDLVASYSRGTQQRLSLARALLHKPDIILFDEPYSGLDQHAARMLKFLLIKVKGEGRTIVMTTHNISRGLEISDNVAVLSRGKLVMKSDLEAIAPAQFEEVYFKLIDQEQDKK